MTTPAVREAEILPEYIAAREAWANNPSSQLAEDRFCAVHAEFVQFLRDHPRVVPVPFLRIEFYLKGDCICYRRTPYNLGVQGWTQQNEPTRV